MKADMIHMATKNITMDTFDKKKWIAQRLAASMTLENAAQVYQYWKIFSAQLRSKGR
jgi:hypothetical protein